MNRTALLAIITFCGFIPFLSAQTYTVTTPSGSGTNGRHVGFTMNSASNNSASFYLFGDGHYSTRQSPTHEYHTGGAFQPEVYSLAVYVPTVPSKISNTNPNPNVTSAVGTGSSTANPYIPANQSIHLGQSWRAADDNEMIYIISFRHPGSPFPINGTAHGSITLTLDENIDYLQIINPSVATNWASSGTHVSLPKGDQVTWTFSGLNNSPGDVRNLYVRVKIPNNMQGDRISSNVHIEYIDDYAIKYSETRTRNSYIYRYPHDPNGIIAHNDCLLSETDAQQMEYTVYFQNEGENYANNVQIEINPDWLLIPNSIEIIRSSAPTSQVEHDPNTGLIYITFPGINLPGLEQHYPNTYCPDLTTGFVTFSICAHDMISANGPPIDVDANIYFDQQPPIYTGIASTFITETCTKAPPCNDGYGGYGGANTGNLNAAMTSNMNTDAATVYPNPFTDQFIIGFDVTEAEGSLINAELYDLSGKLQTTIFKGYKDRGYCNFSVNAQGLPSGIYIVKIQSGNQQILKRIVKG